ncbi:hypothetical protein D3C84_650860 [compost metagenome]
MDVADLGQGVERQPAAAEAAFFAWGAQGAQDVVHHAADPAVLGEHRRHAQAALAAAAAAAAEPLVGVPQRGAHGGLQGRRCAFLAPLAQEVVHRVIHHPFPLSECRTLVGILSESCLNQKFNKIR